MSANLLPISSQGGFITGGNIVVSSYPVSSPAPYISGFSSVSADSFNLLAGNINGGIATVVTDGINSIALALGAQMDVFGFPFSAAGVRGQLTITDVTTPSEANGTWYYQSVSDIAYQLYTNSTYSTLVDATSWSAYTGGGNVAITKQTPAANIVINSNGYLSKFGTTGNLTLPNNLSVDGGEIYLTGEGLIRSNNDTVTIQSYDTANSIGRGLRVGDNGGLYLEQGSDQPWLNIVPNVGNAEIYAGIATGGAAGHSLSIAAGAADQTDYYTTAGGNVNIVGGLGASNDGGGGGPGGSVNISSGASADSAGHYGNVLIQTGGSNNWTFAYTGNLTAPGAITTTSNISGGTLLSTNASGNEGGELQFAKPPNGTLAGGITIDAYVNQVRFLEQGGSARGLYMDIANSPAGQAAIGYRDIPQVAASNTTLAATDAGKHYYSTTAGNLTLTIPNNATTSFATGTAISIVVQAAGNILVNASAGVTLYIAGNSTAANRVVGAYGMATLMKVASDTWFINGTGVS